MASTPPSSADDAPDLDVLRTAIGSGDPTLAMPALTKLRFCTDEEAVPPESRRERRASLPRTENAYASIQWNKRRACG